ncbi:MAG: peptidylprolyl isomerase [Bacteroidota bacterium]|nr:peptidylprolyl isomerase [Bacteroidota bacterium]
MISLPSIHLRSGCLILLVILLTTGCQAPIPDVPYVARVGDQILTQDEINRLLENRSAMLDSSDAVSQIVEQWVTNQLLFQEASDRGLRNDPDVQRLLADNERSVMVDALVSRMLDAEMGDGPDESAVQTYYEQHRDKLALREPFVQVAHLVFEHPDSAEIGRQALVAGTALPEVPGTPRIDRQLDDEAFYPQRQLFAAIPGLGEAVGQLRIGETTRVLEHQDAFHVVQVLNRMEAGDVPSLDMVRDEIISRVAIQMRKQLYARQVQRLRTRAMAREELEIR